MATQVTMPQLSDTMDEGTILTWLKKEGDSVSRGDALAEVATDKADLEIECFHEGTLLKIHHPEGATVKVGEVIAVIGEQGESVEDAPAPQGDAAPQPQTTRESQPQSQQPSQRQAPQSQSPQQEEEPAPSETQIRPAFSGEQPGPGAQVNGDARVKISPLARNLAQSYGVDYSRIQGSGEGGRIVKRDIEEQLGTSFSQQQVDAAVAGQTQAPPAQSAAAQQSVESTQQMRSVPPAAQPAQQQSRPAAVPQAAGGQSTETLSKMRQTIANRMVESVTTAPHFYVTAKIHVDKLIDLRKALKPLPQYEGITFNHLVIKAAALALHAVPRINAFFRDNSLIQPQDVNIGIITALPDGLLIPVLKQADALPLADVVEKANALVQRARSGRPKAEDLTGGTFSISNIGKADVESFTAIINPGQGAILAVSSIQEEPIVIDGQLAVGNTMRVTLSVDHRIIDGVLGGQFVTELKRLLEEPVLLLA